MSSLQVVQYQASPTLQRFHHSPAFVRGVMGPVGSGKSVGMCFEGIRLACDQVPNREGVRKTRGLIVRNTLPQLETTTIKTWIDWFPPGDPEKGRFGKMTGRPPYTHYIKIALPDKTIVDLEVLFLALDKPEDVAKLLSFECSWIWFNEAREIPKELVDAATMRVGRYPSPKDGGCTRKSVFMDTNPPDDSHWWYHLAEVETPEGWEFFRQPSGMAPEAENLENLMQPPNWQDLPLEERRRLGRKYYEDMMAGKTEEWIRVYVHGDYGFIKRGMPVYAASWNPDIHVAKEPIRINPTGEIYLGVDSSGRHPATVFLQRSSRGQWQVVHELCITEDEGMGSVNYSHLLVSEIKRRFPDNIIVNPIWCDPAGGWKTQSDERTYFDILGDALRPHGLRVAESPGFRNPERLATVEGLLCRMVDGQPALLVSPTCKMLIRGFNGGYQYRRISTAGDARYDEKPLKNRFADVHDALQYVLCGVGEMRKVLGRDRGSRKTLVMDTNWSV